MTALMSAVANATAAVPRLFALGAVPDAPTYPYGAMSAELGRAGGYTLDARHGLRWGRVTVQTFGKSTDSATALMDSVVSALLDQRLTLADYECGPCRLELDPAITRDPDDHGVIGVTTVFSFVATKETP